MITWNYIMLTGLLLSGMNFGDADAVSHNEPLEVFQVPIMNINVYMMGKKEVPIDIIHLIDENIEYLNQEFEGQLQFVLDELFMDPSQAFLPDIYNNYQISNDEDIEKLLYPIEKKGSINVFLFNTYVASGEEAALMGFTPRLVMGEYAYEFNSPQFDRIFMAYYGLHDKSTLIHEMGHFLGLNHP